MFGQPKKKGQSFVTFGPQGKGFEQMQSHHIMDRDALGGQGKEYDLNIFNNRHLSLPDPKLGYRATTTAYNRLEE